MARRKEAGRTAYLNIQHSPNVASTLIDESRYDELLVIEGFKPHADGDD